jgi:uncharacterized membrane protein YgcG
MLVLAPPAQAQTYSFRVPEMEMQAYVEADGSVRITYAITFANAEFASPIDIVDIGTPSGDYDLSNWRGDRDGVPVESFATSTYIDTGVEVRLANPIGPGQTGTLNIEFSMPPGLLYEDVTRDGFVSYQLTPTWFDESVVEGTGTLRIAVHMLPGIEAEEVYYQDRTFTEKVFFQDRTVVIWEDDSWGADGPYRVGVSFPNRGLPASADTPDAPIRQQSVIDLFFLWLEQNPFLFLLIWFSPLALVAFAFFRFSGGTGIMPGLLLLAATGAILLFFPPSLFCLIPLSFGAVIWVELTRRGRSRSYVPPIIQVEGGGIKRGLTAPEAAVILEEPLPKVLTLVIFGMLKKGILVQTEASPLKVKLAEGFSGDDPLAARLAAQKLGVVLHDYELDFIGVIAKAPEGLVSQMDFNAALKGVITSAVDRMRGFDLSDTQDYYRQIIKRALVDAQGLGDLKVREEALDKNLEWVLLNRNLPPTVFAGPSWSYRPLWMRPPIVLGGGLPTAGASSLPSVGPAPAGPRPSSAGGPTLGDVAGGMAGWAENTMGQLAGSLLPGGSTAARASGGAVNLSGFDRVTGDVFKALSAASASGSRRGGGSRRSGGGGGRRGGGCACACAGCACACACAGGGR